MTRCTDDNTMNKNPGLSFKFAYSFHNNLRLEKNNNRKFSTLVILCILIFAALVIPQVVVSLVTSTVRIPSSGNIGQVVTATSGSIADIQEAVDWVVAAGGGTVYIPAGTYTFDVSDSDRVEFSIPSEGIEIIGAGIDTTILQVPTRTNDDGSPLFVVDGRNGGQLRISGITFKGNPDRSSSTASYSGIVIRSCTDFRVDHCSFWDMGGHGVAVSDGDNMYGHSGGDIDLVSQGVVDHCEFHRIYKSLVTAAGNGWGYGVFIARAYSYLWGVPNLYPEDPWSMFGQYYKNIYIEDCYFEGCRHAVTGNFAGAYVLRYSTIEDQGMYSAVTTGHPSRYNTIGMLCQEIYGNTFRNTGTYTSKHIGFLIEGGSSLIYNNVIDDIGGQVLTVGTSETVNDFFPLGNINNVYFWNNQITGSTMSSLYVGTNAGGTPIEGEDYWTDITGAYATSEIQAIVDSKGYSSYQYPHPLTLD